MERVQDTPNTIEVFENDIDLYLHQFMDEQNIDDFRTVPQSVWNGALRYIYNHVFKHNNYLLKQTNNTVVDGNKIPSTFNAYNYELLLEIVDYYIFNMCMVNNKEVSILGFTTLTGIDESVIYDWGNEERGRLSTLSAKIYKKLSTMREESLSNKLADGKQNPVGVIAMLNRHYGWSSPYTADANRQKTQMSLDDVQRAVAELSQNTAQLPQNEP